MHVAQFPGAGGDALKCYGPVGHTVVGRIFTTGSSRTHGEAGPASMA
jgi:hypothetical protein